MTMASVSYYQKLADMLNEAKTFDELKPILMAIIEEIAQRAVR